ncbi:MAG: hypothetical protein QNJ72_35285 [Pleurocapsa sp. MO_226.B13]|nr:hypothetical protein [Pleurocapsa sp. MO_226.B13]
MNNYPKLEPIQLRDEAQPGYEAIAWKPTWKCFCCHDTGLVQHLLVKKVIPRYVSGRHKPVECNATHCDIQLGRDLYKTETLDRRFSADLCDRLDGDERQMWAEWSKEQHQKRLKLIDSNVTKNLRFRSRTNYEQLEVEHRHQNIKNDY